jgi:hypothetical protein
MCGGCGPAAFCHLERCPLRAKPKDPGSGILCFARNALRENDARSQAIARLNAAARVSCRVMSASKTPAPGDLAPDFSLTDSTGASVTLAGLTDESPCVIVFYRGHW